MGRAIAVQGVRRSQAARARGPRAYACTRVDAAVAGGARRGGAAGAGRRLVAVRLRGEPRGARHVPALSPRAGTVEAAARARGSVRARDARSVPDLSAGRYWRGASSLSCQRASAAREAHTVAANIATPAAAISTS